MSGRAYYNENDPAAAHTLRELISLGLIAPGDVDSRSIKEVQPDDLQGYTQHHFFAGMGGWSAAARLAGWPDDRPIWSASCPCQPFSAAGKCLGTNDPRHLWPDLFRLWRAFRPAVGVGEQVAGAPGYGWFNGVRADLAGEGYGSRVVDIPACAIDAPHQRNRLYWVALGNGVGAGLEGQCGYGAAGGRALAAGPVTQTDGSNGVIANTTSAGRISAAQHGIHRETQGQRSRHGEPERLDAPYGLHANTDPARGLQSQRRIAKQRGWVGDSNYRRNGSFWSDGEWLLCHDGKARRTKPGLRLLVDGMAGRIDAWRLAGNGIVLPLAAEVIAALIDVYDWEKRHGDGDKR